MRRGARRLAADARFDDRDRSIPLLVSDAARYRDGATIVADGGQRAGS
jgi:hypothetical protein